MPSPVVYITTPIPGLNHSSLPKPWEGFLLPPSSHSLAARALAHRPDLHPRVRALVSLLSEKLTAEDLTTLKKAMPNLAIISNYAVGFNNIDVKAATALGIRVTNTPGVLAEATANIALILLLMTSRRILEGAQEMCQQGRFGGWAPHYLLGMDLAGKTLGIVGLGSIGSLLASKAESLGMRVVALASSNPKAEPVLPHIPRLGEAEFLATLDALSLHCPLTDSTRGWLNRHRISSLKKGCLVINTARGEIIDEGALADALNSDHLMAAGLDVFCNEPTLSPELRAARNLVVLPHLGSATRETRTAMGQLIQKSLEEFLAATPKTRLTYQVG